MIRDHDIWDESLARGRLISRRNFCALAGTVATFGSTAGLLTGSAASTLKPLLKPRRLREGDVVGLVSPGGAIFRPLVVKSVEESLTALGLRTKLGASALNRRGYLAGSDADRANDLTSMFVDPEVDAVLALRGGWGCNRILPLLDYELIGRNPKILMGFSDVTSLLLALYVRCGLVTFHGPVGVSSWNDFTVEYVRRILFDGEAVRMDNPRRTGPALLRGQDRIRTITPGVERGRLVGGNLSVLVSMIGSAYEPDWEGHILFLEDTEEEPYRIDRMLTQLSLAGVLSRISGIVFGKCTRCEPEREDESLTLEEVLSDHLEPLGIPSWQGAMIGHISDKFTIPVGIMAEIDANRGSITMLEAAVAPV